MHVLPLKSDTLSYFFENNEDLFDIDYPASCENLGSPLAVLTYVANLGMTCLFHGEIDSDLVTQYFTTRSLTDIKTLQMIHANILHYGKFGKVLYQIDQFQEEQIEQFIVNHEELIQYHMAFVNSTKLYLYSQIDESVKNGKQTTEETFPQLGFSILQLFGLEDFMVIYMADTPPIEDLIYFKRYFDDPMFNGAPLLLYFNHPNNMYAGLALTVANMDQSHLEQLQGEWNTIEEEIKQATSAA